MSRAKEPMAAWPEYRFPWGWVTIALAASFALGMGVWGYYVDGLGTNFLASGAFLLACSLYFLRRAARDETRLREQGPMLPSALADQANAWSGEGTEDEAAPSRPAP
jgi:hypothetical protein